MQRTIAFYAPLKPTDHPIASGDREIARLIVAALERAGHRVVIPSRFVSYQKRPSQDRFEALRTEGEAEAARVGDALAALPRSERPDAWLTYHPYCKAPDWIGPAVARRLGIAYATAEACRTHQDSDADWQAGRTAVAGAIRQASVNFCLKRSDAAYLDTVLETRDCVRSLVPFLDLAALPPLPLTREARSEPVIVTAGMMRPGKKTDCHLMLAEALTLIAERPFRVVVLGDGPERGRIEAAYAGLPADRVGFRGAVGHADVIAAFDAADLFAWPGLREPIGMVYLEAQARGLPIAACASLGVPDVVEDGVTGLLARDWDMPTYAGLIGGLLADPELRARLGEAGRARIAQRHDITAASATLSAGLEAAIAAPAVPAASAT